MDYQGQRCLGCGQIIKVYCLSGYCRDCFHIRRGERGSKDFNCPHCGRFQSIEGLCIDCRNSTPGYIEKYRSRSVAGIIKPEHRAVWEKAFGELPLGWVVHHLNGLKGDNRLKNLKGMPKYDHDSKAIVSALKERIRQLEALIMYQKEV